VHNVGVIPVGVADWGGDGIGIGVGGTMCSSGLRNKSCVLTERPPTIEFQLQTSEYGRQMRPHLKSH